jgi:hypothetical protein
VLHGSLDLHLDNDIQQANMMYNPLKNLREADEKNTDMVIGIQFYYMRLVCSQVREGLKVIMDIPQHDFVQRLVDADPQAKAAAEYFAEFKPKGKYHDDFNKFVSIRNILTFHYSTDELPDWYQLELAEKAKTESTGSIYVPDEDSPFPLRYGFIDELNISILRKHILQLTGSDAEILEQGAKLTSAICTKFMEITAAITEGVLKEFQPKTAPVR